MDTSSARGGHDGSGRTTAHTPSSNSTMPNIRHPQVLVGVVAYIHGASFFNGRNASPSRRLTPDTFSTSKRPQNAKAAAAQS